MFFAFVSSLTLAVSKLKFEEKMNMSKSKTVLQGTVGSANDSLENLASLKPHLPRPSDKDNQKGVEDLRKLKPKNPSEEKASSDSRKK